MKCYFLWLALALFPIVAQATEVAGAASVIDGDTLEVQDLKVRLFGIDAPESRQICHMADQSYLCGQQAANALAAKLINKIVSCKIEDEDRYQRLVGRCRGNDEDVSQWMVSQGLALAYRQYSRDYVVAEEQAQAQQLGIWRGSFQDPAKYRVEHRMRVARVQAPPNKNCAIKGNIGMSGKQLYHLPGSRDYARTRVSTNKGERWFCTEKDAIAAGWREAR